jgi:hypothetical protein
VARLSPPYIDACQHSRFCVATALYPLLLPLLLFSSLFFLSKSVTLLFRRLSMRDNSLLLRHSIVCGSCEGGVSL